MPNHSGIDFLKKMRGNEKNLKQSLSWPPLRIKKIK